MKQIMALAIDVLLTTPAFANSDYFDGGYGGIQMSHFQLETRHTDMFWWFSNASNVDVTKQSTVGGLRTGYDWVKGLAICGVLGEASFGNQSSFREIGEFLPMYKVGSLRAEAGIVSEKTALFATAGVAFAAIQRKYAETYDSTTRGTFNAKGDGTGYVVGVGTIDAISPKSSIGIDISRYQFGSYTHETLDANGMPGSALMAKPPMHAPGKAAR